MNTKKKNKTEMLRNLLTTGSIDSETEDDPMTEEIVIDDVAEIEVPEGRTTEMMESATAVSSETADVSPADNIRNRTEKEPIPAEPAEDTGSLIKEIETLRKEIVSLRASSEEYITSREQHKAYMAAINKRDSELANKKFITLLEQLCAMREDFFKLCKDMDKKLDRFSSKDVLESFTAYSVDMENILADAGVHIGRFDYDKLNTIHQRIVDVIPTQDEALNGTVAERLSDGYEFEGRVLFKEKVKIYKSIEQTTQTETIQENDKESKGEE